jgi:hypothetical protein
MISLSKPTTSGGCSCCDKDEETPPSSCAVEIRSVTATLSLIGYSAFGCGSNVSPTPPYTRYLTYKASGFGNFIDSCNSVGSYREPNASVTYTIDPFTGITCQSGSVGVSFLCNGTTGNELSCTDTNAEYDCGITSDECGQTQFKFKNSLEDPYTIEDVLDNVDTMLSRVDSLVYTGMPPQTIASVKNGTGHSVLVWQATRNHIAQFYKTDTSVLKTRLYVRFLADTVYYLNNTAYNGTAGQEIVVNAPLGQNVSFTPYCNLYLPNYIITNNNGTVTTKTRTIDNYDPYNCGGINYLLGPDCEKYDKIVATTTAQYSRTYTETYTSSPPTTIYSTKKTITDTSSYNRTETNQVGADIPGCSSNDFTDSGSSTYIEDQSNTFSTRYHRQTTNSIVNGYQSNSSSYYFINPTQGINTSDSYTDEPGWTDGGVYRGDDCGNYCPPQYNAPLSTENTAALDTYQQALISGEGADNLPTLPGFANCQPIVTETRTVSRSPKSITCVNSYKKTYLCNELNTEGNPTGTKITESESWGSTYRETYSYTGGVEEEYTTDTQPNHTNCAQNYSSADYQYRSNVDSNWEMSYTASGTSEVPVNHVAWFHHTRETTNASNPYCVIKTLQTYNQIVPVSSTGSGTVSSTLIVPTPGTDSTYACAIWTAVALVES